MFIKFINKFTLFIFATLLSLLTEMHATPILANLNFSQDEVNLMMGRETELNQIQQILKNKHRVSIGGLPGVGKSYLAMFYASVHQKEYDIVWLIDCEKTIYSEYKAFSQAINSTFNQQFIDLNCSDVNLINSLKEFLRKTQYKWLIIYDNCILQEEHEKYFPMSADGKNYLLLKSGELSDLNLKEMLLTDRVKLFGNVSNLHNIKQIKDIIAACHLNNTEELVEAAKKKQRGHPVISVNQNHKICILSTYNKNKPIHEIILQLKNNYFSSYELIQYLSIFGSIPIEVGFIKEIYLLNTLRREQDFYNDIDILISKHLSYYENNKYIMLPGVIQNILLNSIIINQDQNTFQKLAKGIMRYIKNNILIEHKSNINSHIYNYIYNLIKIGKTLGCNNEILDLYFVLVDYHIKFDRDLTEINSLLNKISNTFNNKNMFIQTKIKYLSKLSNYYFMLGQLEKSLSIEKKLSKLLQTNKHTYEDKKDHEYDIIFNKIMLLKIYSNMGELLKCEAINIPKLEEKELEAKFLYLKSHYMEVKSYIKYLKSDLSGALDHVNNALTIAFDLAKNFNAEKNIYYTCAHLFSKKYLYMFEMGLDTNEINQIYYKIYAQAVNKEYARNNFRISTLTFKSPLEQLYS